MDPIVEDGPLGLGDISNIFRKDSLDLMRKKTLAMSKVFEIEEQELPGDPSLYKQCDVCYEK
jgi:hypothetical protein